jgi:hypothetical protein
VIAGWEGSPHDATILADNLERVDGLEVPDGMFYLADASYTCRPGFIPTFRSIRYHLNDLSTRNYLKNVKELFNLRHPSPRVTIDRVFTALKIPDQKPFHPFPPKLSFFLHVAFYTTDSCGGVLMSSSRMRTT